MKLWREPLWRGSQKLFAFYCRFLESFSFSGQTLKKVAETKLLEGEHISVIGKNFARAGHFLWSLNFTLYFSQGSEAFCQKHWERERISAKIQGQKLFFSDLPAASSLILINASKSRVTPRKSWAYRKRIPHIFPCRWIHEKSLWNLQSTSTFPLNLIFRLLKTTY